MKSLSQKFASIAAFTSMVAGFVAAISVGVLAFNTELQKHYSPNVIDHENTKHEG